MDYMLDFVADLVEERVDLDDSQFSESILERWYSAHASQQNVVNLEFGSPCPSRSPTFSHDPSCHDQINNGFPVFSRCVLSATLNVSLSWTELSGTFFVFVSITNLLVFSCVSTLGSLLSSDERAWITLVSITGLPVLSEETSSSWKDLTSISWERDVFLSTCVRVIPDNGFPVLSWIGFRIDWFDWKLLESCSTSDRYVCSEPNSLFHSCFKETFNGGRSDAKTFFYVTASIFYPNDFRNTISSKCFLKNHCISWSLIEFQSFRKSKIDVDPICVLMSFPCIMHQKGMTRYIEVNIIKILVTFVHRVNK